jgi:hypothetical protein
MKQGLWEVLETSRIVSARPCFCRASDTVYVKLQEDFRVFAKYFFNLLLPSHPINGALRKNLRVF